MATDMQRLVGMSEDEEEEMEMGMKDEDDDDDDEYEENGVEHGSASGMVEIDGGSGMGTATGDNRFQQHQQFQEQVGSPGGSTRRSRPLEEKERTKLRERRRRAITARILAGLRRHGNYNLRVRADINDVIAALAREAGWVVLPDGTTFPSKSQVIICQDLNLHFPDSEANFLLDFVTVGVRLLASCVVSPPLDLIFFPCCLLFRKLLSKFVLGELGC